MVDEFRCLIAALYGKSYEKNETKIHGSAKSTDVADRCAYYANSSLDLKAMKAGHEKDSDTFTFSAIYNDHVLHNSKLRKLLEDEYLRGFLIHLYRRRCKQIHDRWPGFDPQPQAEWLRDELDLPTRDGNASSTEVSRQLAMLDRKLTVLGRIVTSIIVIMVWVGVFYLALPKIDHWLGPGWATVTGIGAFFGAAILAGTIQQRIERQFRSG